MSSLDFPLSTLFGPGIAGAKKPAYDPLAQSQLKEIIARLGPDEDVVITENYRPVAGLVTERSLARSFANREESAGELIGIKAPDHIVLGSSSATSIRESG